MGNTAFTLLILFLLSTCLLLEVVHTNNGLENQIQTNLKFEKVDDGWVVYLSTDDHPSIDVSGKTFLLQFNHALEEESFISFALETISPGKENVLNGYFHRSRYRIVLSLPQVIFTPASKFPIVDLVHSRRLFIYEQSNCELTSVTLIDPPPAIVFKEEMFLSKVWDFYQAINKSFVNNPDLVLDVSTPELFAKTFWNSPMFRPHTFNIDFTPFLESPRLDSPASSTYNNKVVYDGANPNARLITLMSLEFKHVLWTLAKNPSKSSFNEIFALYRLFGHFSGRAIANSLPIDMSLSDDLYRALTMEREHPIISNIDEELISVPVVEERALINEFCIGFWSVVPRKLLIKFDLEELGWLITGRPADLINISFLKVWAKYEPGLTEETTHIKWFWAYVATLSQSQLTTLWEMITGSPRLAAHVNNKIGYQFMIVTSSLRRTLMGSMDCLLPVGIYHGALEPPLLYIPLYSSELVLQTNFKRIIL